MRVPIAARRSFLLAGCVASLAATAAPAGAQVRGTTHDANRGLRVGGTVAFARPMLDDRSAQVWQYVGDLGASAGLGLSLGYDLRRVGMTAELDLARTPIGGREGVALTVAALGHWRVAREVAGWRPTLVAGYVRQGLGGVDVARDELPPGVGAGSDPNDLTLRSLGIFGNGARLGFTGARPVSARTALVVELTADLVKFDSADYDGFSYPIRDGGWSTTPRLAVGVQWRPLAR